MRCIGTLLLNDTKCNYWMLLNHIEEKDCTRVQRRESRGEDGMSMQEADPAGVTKALESLAAGMEPDASLVAEHTWLKRGLHMDLHGFTMFYSVVVCLKEESYVKERPRRKIKQPKIVSCFKMFEGCFTARLLTQAQISRLQLSRS